MTRENFIDTVTYLVKEYMNDFSDFDSNPQIRVNPATLGLRLINGSEMLDELADSDERVEDAAGAQGAASEVATDFQVTYNPDFYPVKDLLKVETGKPAVPDTVAIRAVAEKYF